MNWLKKALISMKSSRSRFIHKFKSTEPVILHIHMYYCKSQPIVATLAIKYNTDNTFDYGCAWANPNDRRITKQDGAAVALEHLKNPTLGKDFSGKIEFADELLEEISEFKQGRLMQFTAALLKDFASPKRNLRVYYK